MDANYFTILYWFCQTSTCICHKYTSVPHPEHPSLSLPILSLWVIPVHQPQASCNLHQTWTGASFLMWYYTCFNAILQNHPTLTLSHRVQKTSIHLCLFLLSLIQDSWVLYAPHYLDSQASISATRRNFNMFSNISL